MAASFLRFSITYGEGEEVEGLNVPLSVGPPRACDDAKGVKAIVYDCVVHPSVIDEAKVLWLGSLLPRLLTTPNGSQWLPTTPDSSLRLQTHAVVV